MGFTLRIGSRPSALALAQAALVRDALAQFAGGLAAEIVPISTSGDKMTTASLARVGGKGLFIRELEQALSDRRIDIAVHSMKDLPAILPPQYRIVATPRRENPHDVLITRSGLGWDALPRAARLGTSSARRRFEALRVRPDLEVQPLRGNVDTRLGRLRAGEFEAIILAMAGLKRLGLDSAAAAAELDRREFVPSGGQGALAIEALRDGSLGSSSEIESAVAALNDLPTLAQVTAERALLATIGASCVSPVGVNASFESETLVLRALLFSTDGERSLSGESSRNLAILTTTDPAGAENAASELGQRLGHELLERGAAELIRDG
ncbi:MAG TPA: hydroxymethylbilane synthase [Candidatus Binataceae bacterium]|nr:hydroxymethylbilane synthase [Candidatus Binataceae bacterium]